MGNIFRISEKDNVAVALCDLKKGSHEGKITLHDNIPFGHKVSLCDIKNGDKIIKYGNLIGYATEDILAGSHVHTHNIKTALSENVTYSFSGNNKYNFKESNITFQGYERANGGVGVRNDLWIITTVGCVNKTAEKLGEIAKKIMPNECTGVKVITHPYGCSQMGDDLVNTQKVLASLVKHPNAGAVLVVSLGCENNNIEEFKKVLKSYDENRVRFLVTQNVPNEIDEGKKIIEKLFSYISAFNRKNVPFSKLKIGLKCGGSDAFSGITANPLCGRMTDLFTDFGASVILTETPEMFGAEQILMSRAKNEAVFNKIVNMINDYKSYFIRYGQTIYENPSPGNKAGGITTLDEKSLGCVQKGGEAVITDVLGYAEHCEKAGLNLLWGPGNDIVSTTNLVATGAQIILFTTGRGTPLGSVVPTVKISSNTELFKKKTDWIDFNAGELLDGANFEDVSNKLFNLILDIASGKTAKNEINEYSGIAIFKDGVTM